MTTLVTAPPTMAGMLGRLLIALGVMLTAAALPASQACAQEDGARAILKAMSDHLAAQKSVSLTFESDVAVIVAGAREIQFSSSGAVQMVRPNKLRVRHVAGGRAVEIVFDGETLTISDEDNRIYAQVAVPGSIDELLDLLRNEFAVIAPGTDLLFSNVYDVMMADAIAAEHVGPCVIDGVACEHLAFRTPGGGRQIWIAAGDRPVPRQYVVTSKAVAGGLRYTLRIKDAGGDVAPDAFVFKPPDGAQKVALEALGSIDEVPPDTLGIGGAK